MSYVSFQRKHYPANNNNVNLWNSLCPQYKPNLTVSMLKPKPCVYVTTLPLPFQMIITLSSHSTPLTRSLTH